VSDGGGPRVAKTWRGREFPGWPLRSYLVALVVLFVVTAAGGLLYGWTQARQTALDAAAADAAFAADLAAEDLRASFVTFQQSVAQLAANPAVGPALQSPVDPPDCTLSFALPGGGPDAGHLDIVRSDGTVACSSRDADPDTEYAGAAWFARARQAPLVEAPVPDPTTGWKVMLVTAPVQGGGVVVGLINLAELGPALAARFGGPRQVELLVTTGNGRTLLARSIDPAGWIGTDLLTTPFWRADGAAERPDLDGVARLYGQADVAGLGWRVYGGADRKQALGSSTRLGRDVFLIVGVGLAVALIATVLVHRGIARPIGALSTGVRTAGPTPRGALVDASGPREVKRLADEFNGLLAAVGHELAERTRAQEVARELERNYHTLFDANPYPMFVYDVETLALLQVNDAAVAHYGYRREEFLSLTVPSLCLPEDVPAIVDAAVTDEPIDHSGPLRHVKKDGSVIDVRVMSHEVFFGGVKCRCAVVEDITEAEQLDRRLRQSQRLESLGQLAGGVAHDFNNLLGIILGYTNLAVVQVGDAAAEDARWEPLSADLTQVLQAVDRATKITHQLLSFARAELAQSRTLDVNDTLSEIEPMLRRAVGEDIALEIRRAAGLRSTWADPGQIEQVLLNLAVNARDAMPRGGSLLIETDNVRLDEHDAAYRPDVRIGPFVRLRVTDTGSGMSKATVEHAFEPFFTTKPKGKGTGLGLATIYGIVRQANGHVEIESEPGVGTTVIVLLPATDAVAEDARASDTTSPHGHGETVLLVEDEASLRTLTERILTRHNYHVIAAGEGREALEAAGRHGGDINLLLTDVVMPNMPGHELAERLRATRPGLPVIYLSGYAQPFLSAEKTLPDGVTLLTKPVLESVLLTAIRRTLDT